MLKKILTILGSIFLLLGLIFSVYLVSQKINFFSKASSFETPQQVKITNLADNSFTVSWITGKQVAGFISFGASEKLGNTALDDRDVDSPVLRFTHYVTLKDLDPNTVYFYKIGSKAFTQTTASVTNTTPPLAIPIYGSVNKKDGGVPEESLIFINIGDGTLLSGFTRSDGKWLITLNNARTKDLTNYLDIKDADEVKLFVEGASSGTVNSTATVAEGKQILRLVLDETKTTLPFETPAVSPKIMKSQQPQPSQLPKITPSSPNLLDTIKGWFGISK